MCASAIGAWTSAATMDAAMRARRIFGLSIFVALCVPAAAAAHANLVRSVPADRAVIATAPRVVRVVFDDTVRPASGIRAIRNGGGSVLGGKPRVVGGKTLVVPLRNGLGNGAYTVLWRIVSDDGHTEAGVLSFAVGANSAPPLPSLSASSGPTAREVAARWLFFAGLLVAAGGALFRVLVGRARVGVLMPALAAVALGALGLLVGGPSLGTRFGLAYLVAGSLAGIGAACAALALLRPRFAVGAWTAALLVLP